MWPVKPSTGRGITCTLRNSPTRCAACAPSFRRPCRDCEAFRAAGKTSWRGSAWATPCAPNDRKVCTSSTSNPPRSSMRQMLDVVSVDGAASPFVGPAAEEWPEWRDLLVVLWQPVLQDELGSHVPLRGR